MSRRPCQLKPRSAFQVLRDDNRRLERRWKLHIPCLSENQSSWRYGNFHAVYARILDECLESETKHWTNERCALGSARLGSPSQSSDPSELKWSTAGARRVYRACVTINPRARSHTRDHAANRARRGWVGLLELLSISTVRPEQLALMLFVSCFFPCFILFRPSVSLRRTRDSRDMSSLIEQKAFRQCDSFVWRALPNCFVLFFPRKRDLPRKFASCVLSYYWHSVLFNLFSVSVFGSSLGTFCHWVVVVRSRLFCNNWQTCNADAESAVCVCVCSVCVWCVMCVCVWVGNNWQTCNALTLRVQPVLWQPGKLEKTETWVKDNGVSPCVQKYIWTSAVSVMKSELFVLPN